MTGVVVISLAFLACPLLGYAVMVLKISPRAKFIIAVVGVFVLIFVPVLVLLLGGGSGGG